MIDRETLKRAIAAARSPAPLDWSLLPLLASAAERYLETMPKPTWLVTYTLPGGRRGAPYRTEDHGEALDIARQFLSQNNTDVSVRIIGEPRQ